jgi:hypothetical protein
MIKLIKKIDKWVTDQLYDMYPNLTKHMKDETRSTKN